MSNALRAGFAGAAREVVRRTVNIPARLIVGASTHPITVMSVSRFGALVVGMPPISAGTDVELEIARQGPSALRIAARVYWMNDAHCSRIGKRPGAGLQFHEPIAAGDASFSAAITNLIVEQTLSQPRTRSARPTDRMPEPLQQTLVSTMTDIDRRLVFAGDLSTITIADLLMALPRALCGRLEVDHDDTLATLELGAGNIDVRSSPCAVDDCKAFLFELLAWDHGAFRLFSTKAMSTAPRIDIARLLIEHFHLQAARRSAGSVAVR